MHLFSLLHKTAIIYPDNYAIIHNDKKISYHNLAESAVKLANYLEQTGLEKGVRIAILFENSIEYIISYFAILKAGYVVVPLNTSPPTKDIINIINDCQPVILILQKSCRINYAEVVKSCPSLKLIISDNDLPSISKSIKVETLKNILQNSNTNLEDVNPSKLTFKKDKNHPHQLAAIFYTSGSTGMPRGVMLSHLNLISNTLATVEYLKLRPKDSVIVILPFYYIYGNSLLLTHAAVGGTLVIDNRFIYPEIILDTMEKENVTGFSGVPSNFMILMHKSTFTSRKFKHLRYFTQAGGPMAPEVIKRLIGAFPDKEIYIMYGQTEASPRISYLPPNRLNEKIGSVGIPVPGVKISIVNNHGKEVGSGKIGEIVVTGDNVMMGYWGKPKEQKEVLKDGRLFTEDLARKDEDGFIYIVGRKKEIIKSGGSRVSAKEVEECLLEHHKVTEAAVFGIKNHILGEAIKAAVVLKEGAKTTEKELQTFCKRKIGAYKAPQIIEFFDSLPKYKSGKINKLALKEQN